MPQTTTRRMSSRIVTSVQRRHVQPNQSRLRCRRGRSPLRVIFPGPDPAPGPGPGPSLRRARRDFPVSARERNLSLVPPAAVDPVRLLLGGAHPGNYGTRGGSPPRNRRRPRRHEDPRRRRRARRRASCAATSGRPAGVAGARHRRARGGDRGAARRLVARDRIRGAVPDRRGARRRRPTASNLPLENAPLRDHMHERFDLPVGLDNDANAAAIGEWRAGAGRGVDDLVMLTLGTGVGGGVISGGTPFRGRNGGGAELGQRDRPRRPTVSGHVPRARPSRGVRERARGERGGARGVRPVRRRAPADPARERGRRAGEGDPRGARGRISAPASARS